MFSGSITLVIARPSACDRIAKLINKRRRARLLVRLRQQRHDRFARIDGIRFVDDRLFAGIDLDQTADRVKPQSRNKKIDDLLVELGDLILVDPQLR